MDSCFTLTFGLNLSVRLSKKHPGAISQISGFETSYRPNSDYSIIHPFNHGTAKKGTPLLQAMPRTNSQNKPWFLGVFFSRGGCLA